MEETYQFLIELKTIYPLRFWTVTLTLIFLTIFIIWRLSKNNRQTKNEHPETEQATPSIPQEDKTVKSESGTIKEISEPETPSIINGTETPTENTPKVNEPKLTRQKSAETEQDTINTKIETVVVNKQKPAEQLPKGIKPETEKTNGEIKRVNYDISKDPITNSYPIFRFPKKGTVVRSHRLGSTKRRGYKEASFQQSLEQYFGQDFEISGNARLNTGKETRPFEPDVAIIDKSSSNLRIDVEIDEPYAGITRQPTHCKGDDTMRDIYFMDRGWIVIRFSEYQVHLHENECLKFITEVIKSAIPSYEIPKPLVDQPALKDKKLWDIVQAQKWEKSKYRECYLNHEFKTVEERIETAERGFNEQEQNEEKLVNPTPIGVVDKSPSTGFNLINSHPRDKRIEFYPEPHIYTIDKIPAPSASTVISKFFPEFDSYGKASSLSRRNPLFGLPVEEIVKIWSSRGTEAARKGTFLHEQIEKYYLGEQYEKIEEFGLFEKFVSDHKDIKPYRSEWRIFDEENHIAGTIDLVSKNGNGFDIYDWKRSKNVIDNDGKPITKDPWGKVGIDKLDDIDDTSYNRYCLQQSLYRYILEKNYNLTISKMYLVILHPNNDRYHKVEVPYLQEKIEHILRTL